MPIRWKISLPMGPKNPLSKSGLALTSLLLFFLLGCQHAAPESDLLIREPIGRVASVDRAENLAIVRLASPTPSVSPGSRWLAKNAAHRTTAILEAIELRMGRTMAFSILEGLPNEGDRLHASLD